MYVEWKKGLEEMGRKVSLPKSPRPELTKEIVKSVRKNLPSALAMNIRFEEKDGDLSPQERLAISQEMRRVYGC